MRSLIMKSFDVLDRNQLLHRNYLLEASAGTGKTFAIENIVVRLLLEENPTNPDPILLEQILVVTFTRAATRDLKVRIRSNIEKALEYLKGTVESVPDYLQSYIEKGEEAVFQGRRRLEQALFCFDQAQIFTIHGFCSRMLRDNLFEGNMALGVPGTEDNFSDSQILTIIKDYFRTELNEHSFSPAQLKIILQDHQNDTQKLAYALLKEVKRGLDFEEYPDYSAQLKDFQISMKKICDAYCFDSQKIIHDFTLQAPSYKDLCDRSKKLKSDPLKSIERFAELFNKSTWNEADFNLLIKDGLFILDSLDPSQLKSNGKPPISSSLHYPNLHNLLISDLKSIIDSARSPLMIFTRMARGCLKMFKTYLNEEEILSYDELLRTMYKAVQNPDFSNKVRSIYKTAIIDEFQDTDPWQWEIFRTLFVSLNTFRGNLYLVGDPKQSIYSFRQADIYTYLSAAQVLGADHHASLDTNFRSQPSLVKALNALFSSKNTPELISLPRISKILEYPEVKSSTKIKEKTFSDDFGSVHFCIAKNSDANKSIPAEKFERNYFFPFIANEISKLHKKDGLRFSQCSILVHDRYQGKRLHDYLDECGIPAVQQRSTSLIDSQALPALYDILLAVMQPRKESALKRALGGCIIGWTHTEVRALSDPILSEKILSQFYELRSLFLTKGFAAFFLDLMQSRWESGIIELNSLHTITERLLIHRDGLSLHDDLLQIANLLLEEENQKQASLESLLVFLDNLAQSDSDEEKLKRFGNPDRDAVNILSVHSSKGLEFDIVFTLGLINRPKEPSLLIPSLVENGNFVSLTAVLDDKSAPFVEFCQEIDAEKMRQLYVAMTRAKYRLYVPVMINSSGKLPKNGCASPMELFLARLGQQRSEDREKLYDRISGYDGTPLCNFIDNVSSETSITYQQLPYQDIQDLEKMNNSPNPELIPPPTVFVPNQQWHVHSFTGLTKNKHQASKDSIINTPHDYCAKVKDTHTLPAGSETGTILHRILEEISFESLKADKSELINLIRPFVAATPLAAWEESIAEIIFHTLSIGLPTEDDYIFLRDIPVEKRYHEIEFLYPCEGANCIEEMELVSGYLKGVIDLVFTYNGKYYIVDWKSNWLGESDNDYHQINLKSAMQEHNYFLQANIYKEALRRYLRLVDSRPFEDIFGGAFYLFLRGLDSSQNNSAGIFLIH